MKTNAWLLGAAVAVALAAGTSVRGEDLLDNALGDKTNDTAKPAQNDAKPDAAKPTRPNMPDLVSPDAAKQLDDQDLLNKLTGQGNAGAEGGGGPAAKLNDIMERMGQSQDRLAKQRDPGVTTQEVQSRIMVDIDSVIDYLKQQDKQSKSQSKGQPKEGDKREESQSQSQQQQQTKGNEAAKQSQLPSGGISEPSGSGTDMREGRTTWGELPAKDRDLVANGVKEKYLPEYEDMIKRYYEALAELGKSDKDK